MKIKVEKMKCNGCVKTVQEAIEEATGNANVIVDIDSGIAEVNTTKDADEIIAAIKQAGFKSALINV